jgi:CBS domain-containing protein
MTTEVVTVTPATTVAEATRTVVQRRVAALPVVDHEGRLVGIVSELDLLRERVAADPRAHLLPAGEPAGPAPRTVEQVMTREVLALPESSDAAAFAALMAETGVKSVPVVRGDQLVGIVGRRDLLRRLARPDAEVAAEVAALLDGDPSLSGWRVEVSGGEVTLSGAGAPQEQEAVQLLARTVPGVVRVQVRPD